MAKENKAAVTQFFISHQSFINADFREIMSLLICIQKSKILFFTSCMVARDKREKKQEQKRYSLRTFTIVTFPKPASVCKAMRYVYDGNFLIPVLMSRKELFNVKSKNYVNYSSKTIKRLFIIFAFVRESSNDSPVVFPNPFLVVIQMP